MKLLIRAMLATTLLSGAAVAVCPAGLGATGIDVSPAPATAAYLQTLLDSASYIAFAREYPRANGLLPEQELYFKGTLAYREGRFHEVIDPLVAAVQTKHTSLTQSQVESAFEILGQTANKLYLYSSSAKMYADIERLYGAQMGDGVREMQERRHIASLLEHVPVETITNPSDFALERGTGEAAGEYPIMVDGKAFHAQLDTGASVSLLSQTTAQKWGVTLLEGTATLHGYGGGGFDARPGVITSLHIGSAELHNVVVFVTADANLYIAQIKHQTHALLGFPVTSALGRITFFRNGKLLVLHKSPPGAEKVGAPMWVGDGSLLVALGTVPVIADQKLQGGTQERLFELDTGSGSTYFTDHYLAENRSRFAGEPEALARLAGAGGVHEVPAYEAHKLPLFFGVTPVLCTGQHVLAQPQGGEAENHYGVVGQDILRLFSSYTLDFTNMRLSVNP